MATSFDGRSLEPPEVLNDALRVSRNAANEITGQPACGPGRRLPPDSRNPSRLVFILRRQEPLEDVLGVPLGSSTASLVPVTKTLGDLWLHQAVARQLLELFDRTAKAHEVRTPRPFAVWTDRDTGPV